MINLCKPLRTLSACLPLLALLGSLGVATPRASAAATTHRHRARAVCTKPLRHFAHCNAVQLLDDGGHPLVSANPLGLSPADITGAYGLLQGGGAGRVVAIVDAYDDPSAAADLTVYRTTFGLPPAQLTVVAGSGSGPLPKPSAGWAEEESLDLDAVSAVCPNCPIVLVEAASSSIHDLEVAEQTALHLPGVVGVSNSWGGSEPSNVSALDKYFAAPGVFVTASSGDSGYGVEFPAAAPSVVAVGGTTLTVQPGHRYGGETAWSGAGSGCAAYARKPVWQPALGCSRRSVADVSADADPQSGLAVYDTYGQRGGGWFTVGGTSLSAPLIAAVHALAGSTASTAEGLYAPSLAHHDVIGGANGSCLHKVSCTAVKGWDGPTGVGSPAGTNGW